MPATVIGVVEEPVLAKAWPPVDGRSSSAPPTATGVDAVVGGSVTVVTTPVVVVASAVVVVTSAVVVGASLVVVACVPGFHGLDVELATGGSQGSTIATGTACSTWHGSQGSTTPTLTAFRVGIWQGSPSPTSTALRAGLTTMAKPTRIINTGPRIGTLWLSLIGGALAGGLLMAAWLPSFLDSSFASGATPGLYGSLVFIGLNLHHYAIDAAIWRHDGPHVARISAGPKVVDVAPLPTLAPSPA